MKGYTPTIGLEIHAELSTKTKMFCDSKNDTEETKPNTNICPVCMGYPGSLPVINKEAVRQVLRVGVAVDGEIANYTEFDRKNYFYPDIPKGYQISQYKYPLVRGGNIAGVELTRIHLEEDTAKSTHDAGDDSLLDFNRAGVPLMELVTEPVIHDAETASRFAKEFQLLLVYLGVSEANMEKGEMRVEANISVSKDSKLGTKVEVKNLNSFRAVEKAIKFEVERHIDLLEKGEEIHQETRGWDENKEETFSQRSKEDSHDYRYFPDPDLPKLFIKEIPEFDIKILEDSLPELPWEKRKRYKQDFGLKDEDIEIYVRDTEWGRYFEEVISKLESKDSIKLASNYITSDLKKPISTEEFVEVIHMLEKGEISSRGAKDVLKIISEEGGVARTIVESRGLFQKSDTGELEKIAAQIIAGNQKAVEEYKKGNSAPLQFLIGQGMKETRGSANPELLKKIFQKLLE
ncbi:MAG: Asp-tRNA(Asn)/Glu-tRNA(Gln) amidotransferase subunit GatB [Minisyncoccota bacterium]